MSGKGNNTDNLDDWEMVKKVKPKKAPEERKDEWVKVTMLGAKKTTSKTPSPEPTRAKGNKK